MLPFNKKYIPDITFYYTKPISSCFPSSTGSGTILLSPGRVNLANQLWLIDDDCVQFNSQDGCMYLYNLESKKVSKYNLNDLDKSDIEWLNGVGEFSRQVNLKSKQYKDSPESQMEIILGQAYQLFFRYIYFQDENHPDPDYLLGECISFFAHYYDIYYDNGNLIHNNKKLSWSQLGRDIVQKMDVKY